MLRLALFGLLLATRVAAASAERARRLSRCGPDLFPSNAEASAFGRACVPIGRSARTLIVVPAARRNAGAVFVIGGGPGQSAVEIASGVLGGSSLPASLRRDACRSRHRVRRSMRDGPLEPVAMFRLSRFAGAFCSPSSILQLPLARLPRAIGEDGRSECVWNEAGGRRFDGRFTPLWVIERFPDRYRLVRFRGGVRIRAPLPVTPARRPFL